MEEILKKFPDQLLYEPEIIHKENLASYQKILVAGMGGSALAADLLVRIAPDLNLSIHRDYGVPLLFWPEHTLLVASSYSGNTEEALDAYTEARKRGARVAVISSGGELIKKAQSDEVPHIQIPGNIPPRVALGYSIRSLCTLINRQDLSSALASAGLSLKGGDFQNRGEEIAKQIGDRTPLIYSSEQNRSVGYVWKISCNENAKMHAFSNVFPEMNHNEISAVSADRDKFAVILIRDADDRPRIQKRMDVFADLCREAGVAVVEEELQGSTPAEKIFSSYLVGAWMSLALAHARGVDPVSVPVIERFKGEIA